MSVSRLYEMPKDRPVDPDEVLILYHPDERAHECVEAVFADEEQLKDFLREYFERYSDEGEDIEAKVAAVLDGSDYHLGVTAATFYV